MRRRGLTRDLLALGLLAVLAVDLFGVRTAALEWVTERRQERAERVAESVQRHLQDNLVTPAPTPSPAP